MDGIHFTLLGGIALVVIVYWLIHYSQHAATIAGGATNAYSNIAKTFQGG